MSIELIQGDCLDVMPLFPPGRIDMILADPPYGTTACKWDSVIPFEPMWAQLKRLIKPEGATVLFGSEPFSSALRMSNIKPYKYDWVWMKPQGVDPFMSKIRPLNNIENISVFCGGKTIYNPQFEGGAPYTVSRDSKPRILDITGTKMKPTKTTNGGFRYPKRILSFNRDTGLHPTQKPVALMEYLIKTYTMPGDRVLDFTMGSGTTGVACRNTGRDFIGIEKDPQYFKIAQERCEVTP